MVTARLILSIYGLVLVTELMVITDIRLTAIITILIMDTTPTLTDLTEPWDTAIHHIGAHTLTIIQYRVML